MGLGDAGGDWRASRAGETGVRWDAQHPRGMVELERVGKQCDSQTMLQVVSVINLSSRK